MEHGTPNQRRARRLNFAKPMIDAGMHELRRAMVLKEYRNEYGGAKGLESTDATSENLRMLSRASVDEALHFHKAIPLSNGGVE